MPAKSKAQFKLMKGICEGNYPSGYRGISKKVACEYVKGQSPKKLPARKSKIKGRNEKSTDMNKWYK